MTYNNCTAVPAYNRDYTSKDKLMADWHSGKDFALITGKFFSNRDVEKLKESGFTHIHFRYGKQRKVAVIKL